MAAGLTGGAVTALVYFTPIIQWGMHPNEQPVWPPYGGATTAQDAVMIIGACLCAALAEGIGTFPCSAFEAVNH